MVEAPEQRAAGAAAIDVGIVLLIVTVILKHKVVLHVPAALTQ